jgi:hypothetical protein
VQRECIDPARITFVGNVLIGTLLYNRPWAPRPNLAPFREAFDGRGKAGRIPGPWDGKVAERIATEIAASAQGREGGRQAMTGDDR